MKVFCSGILAYMYFMILSCHNKPNTVLQVPRAKIQQVQANFNVIFFDLDSVDSLRIFISTRKDSEYILMTSLNHDELLSSSFLKGRLNSKDRYLNFDKDLDIDLRYKYVFYAGNKKYIYKLSDLEANYKLVTLNDGTQGYVALLTHSKINGIETNGPLDFDGRMAKIDSLPNHHR